jgi:hypothetical protein
MLDPVTGELLRTALDAFTATPDRPDADAERGPGQRRVDALGDLCRAALDRSAAGSGQQRPHVTVTVAWETLRGPLTRPAPSTGSGRSPFAAVPVGSGGGLARLASPSAQPGAVALLGAGGEPVGAETARRLACDAGIVPAVLGSAGEPLDIGRLTRTVPTGMRRALHLRDRGCRFPGCDRPGHRCDAHHLRHWSRGGATSMENLVLVCPFHHWLIHEGRWRVDYHAASNTLTAFRPDGGPYDLTSGPPGPGP